MALSQTEFLGIDGGIRPACAKGSELLQRMRIVRPALDGVPCRSQAGGAQGFSTDHQPQVVGSQLLRLSRLREGDPQFPETVLLLIIKGGRFTARIAQAELLAKL